MGWRNEKHLWSRKLGFSLCRYQGMASAVPKDDEKEIQL
jgi:hypothetical protein